MRDELHICLSTARIIAWSGSGAFFLASSFGGGSIAHWTPAVLALGCSSGHSGFLFRSGWLRFHIHTRELAGAGRDDNDAIADEDVWVMLLLAMLGLLRILPRTLTV